jgi:hypothetical protein
MIPHAPETFGGIAIILNAVFAADKRDPVSFMFDDVARRLAPKPQSSEMSRSCANKDVLSCAARVRGDAAERACLTTFSMISSD